MLRVLKNDVRSHIGGSFRGRKIVFRSKASKTFDMDKEEERAEYYYWKETYGFIRDITDNVPFVNEER